MSQKKQKRHFLQDSSQIKQFETFTQFSCCRCQELLLQLEQKEIYIKELILQLEELNQKLYQRDSQIKTIFNQSYLELKEMEKKFKLHTSVKKKIEQENIELKYQMENFSQVIQESHRQNSKESKFIQSIIQMFKSCHPKEYFQNKEPGLKETWNWLKFILEDYILLKQRVNNKK